MATNQFIGLTMIVTLLNPERTQLRGIVKGINSGKSLTLSHVTALDTGSYFLEHTLDAKLIADLREAPAVSPPSTPPKATYLEREPETPQFVPAPTSIKKTFEDPAILRVGRHPTPAQRILTPVEKKIPTPVATVAKKPAVRSELPESTKENKKTNTKQVQKSTPKPPKRGKGWRQTPLLEDGGGWATEDATDVQDLGDFDFEGSLAKFDKKTVFTQIQAQDLTADEDRLVSHNRKARVKPGTAGGKNLHYTENVLDTEPAPRQGRQKIVVPVAKSLALFTDSVHIVDSPTAASLPKIRAEDWNSDADDSTVERINHRDAGSGRSRRAESKMSIKRKSSSRKGSAQGIAPGPHARSLSVPAPGASKGSFYLVPSNKRCEAVSALQMLNVENIVDNDLGLTEAMMAENAGRGIAEVALSAVNNIGRGGLTRGKSTVIPTVVVFAGNNKNGLRAVAAGRHLRNHGLNVVVCVLGLEREAEFLVDLTRQINVFRNFGGKVVNKFGLLEYVKSLNAPVEIIIDGLLGLAISFEELRTGDQATAFELIEFANRSTAAVIAIDIPTGIDPMTGKVSIFDGRQLYMHPKFVVAMGVPKKGLLEAMLAGEGDIGESLGREWQLFVADLGLGSAAWNKAGTRLRRGVEFDGSWVLGMRFQGSE